jgi:hypothetical protein
MYSIRYTSTQRFTYDIRTVVWCYVLSLHTGDQEQREERRRFHLRKHHVRLVSTKVTQPKSNQLSNQRSLDRHTSSSREVENVVMEWNREEEHPTRWMTDDGERRRKCLLCVRMMSDADACLLPLQEGRKRRYLNGK